MGLRDDELFAHMPDDIIEPARRLLRGARQAEGWLASTLSDTVKTNLDLVSRLKGDPAALHRGETLIRRNVGGHVAQAQSQLQAGLDGINIRGAWEGPAANAFLDYVPRLVAAMTTMQERSEGIADAIAGLRDAVIAMWSDVIAATVEAAADTAAALGNKDKVKLVTEIVNAWTGAIKSYIEAFFAMYDAKFKSLDTLNNAAKNTAHLTEVAGSGNPKYDGPTGRQLPMPTDVSLNASWTPTDLRARWRLKGGDQFAIQLEPFNALIRTVRSNGEHWIAASDKLVEAWLAMPYNAFSLAAAGFYPKLCDVLADDYLTYLYADERLNQLGNLLGKVGEAYGQSDANASRMLREYQTNA